MGRIYSGIGDLVGHTPLVRLGRWERHHSLAGRLLAKVETYNPSGSVKDRIAASMVAAAEAEGKLVPGATIVEATSGNTGIGLAALGAAKGYPVVLVMPDNLSRERVQILEAFGARVVFTPAALNMPGANARAAEIAASIPGSWIPGQGGNPANPRAHRENTGPELWDDSDGSVDVFVAAAGTGGTLTGVGQFLKSKNPAIRVVAVEPAGSAVLSGGAPGLHKIQGIGGGSIPPVLDRTIYDEVVAVTDDDAYEAARTVAKVEGLLVGPSAGAALWAATQVALRPENRGKTVAFIVPDSGERYLSSDLYAADFRQGTGEHHGR